MIETAGLPHPLWNPRLYLDGDRLADPAAYWPRHGVLLETVEPARPVRHRVGRARGHGRGR
jgi:hypothetical protein